MLKAETDNRRPTHPGCSLPDRRAAFRARLRVVADLVERGAADQIGVRLGCGATALESVPTAVCVFLLHPDSYPDAVRLAVSLGGDTDTVASMTGAIVGARVGAAGIPPAWTHRSEGTERMIELADRFADRFADRLVTRG